MISCRDIAKLSSQYLDKDLPLITRMRIKMHLMMCVHCHRFMKQLQTTINTVKRLKEPEISHSDIDNQVANLLQQHRQNQK